MKSGIIAVLLFWLLVVGLSCWWNLDDERRESERLAFETARAFFKQVVITRAWNAGLGGVYVPVSKDVAPNPYLADPLRDVVTRQELALTKINPAHMTRQIAELASLQQGIVQREQLISDLKEANSQIKTLCGIVPICMYCKEIRDDKGYWNQLEKFISEHSTAKFSHGICPKCMKERHPDVTMTEG